MAETLKIAVVTPYYQPSEEMIRQCRDSVRAQTLPCTHIAVADGHPLAMFDGAEATLHVKLPQSNKDFGNTPRYIGAVLAGSYGFDAVAFLDDDNWYEPNHLETLAELHKTSGAPLVACYRRFRHLDGSVLETTEPAEDKFAHVDTNCWLVCRPAFPLFAAWLVPKSGRYVADRIFYQKAVRERYRIASTRQRTVNYRTKHPSHYLGAKVPIPPEAYTHEALRAEFAAISNPAVMAEIVNHIGFYPRLG